MTNVAGGAVLVVLSCLLGGAIAQEPPAAAEPLWAVELLLEKEAFAVGEPIAVGVRLRNMSAEPRRLQACPDASQCLGARSRFATKGTRAA